MRLWDLSPCPLPSRCQQDDSWQWRSLAGELLSTPASLEAVYGSLVNTLAPTVERSQQVEEWWSSPRKQHAGLSLQLWPPVLMPCWWDEMWCWSNSKLQPVAVARARVAPFSGQHLVGPDPEEFDAEHPKLKDQHALQGQDFQQKDFFQCVSQLGPVRDVKEASPRRDQSFCDKENVPKWDQSVSQCRQNARAANRGGGWGRNCGGHSQGAPVTSGSGRKWLDGGSTPGIFLPAMGESPGQGSHIQDPPGQVKLLWLDHPPTMTHHSMGFGTRNTRRELQSAVDSLLSKGAVEPVFWISWPLLCQETGWDSAQSSGGQRKSGSGIKGIGPTCYGWPPQSSIRWLGGSPWWCSGAFDWVRRRWSWRSSRTPHAKDGVLNLADTSLQGTWSDARHHQHINMLKLETILCTARGYLPVMPWPLHTSGRKVRLSRSSSHAWPSEFCSFATGWTSRCRLCSFWGLATFRQMLYRVQRDTCDRVGYRPAASGSSALQMGDTSDRPFCHFCEQEAARLCITIPVLQGQVRWCDVCPLVRDWNCVCLITIQDAASGHQQDPESSQPHSDPDHTTDGQRCGCQTRKCLSTPIPLVQDRLPLLSQEVALSNRSTETRHYQPGDS